MRQVERLEDLVLAHFLGARFHHHDRVLAAGDDEIEAALAALLEGRVDEVLAVDEAHAHAGNRPGEGDARERERRRRAGDREDVAVVIGIGGDDKRDDLRLVPPAGREEWPDRPVDEPARQDFLLGRFAFALEEATRNPSRGVGVFAVVNRQRQEIDAFARVGRSAGRDEHHGVAGAHDDRAVGLFREAAGFDRQGVPTDRDIASMHCVSFV